MRISLLYRFERNKRYIGVFIWHSFVTMGFAGLSGFVLKSALLLSLSFPLAFFWLAISQWKSGVALDKHMWAVYPAGTPEFESRTVWSALRYGAILIIILCVWFALMVNKWVNG